MDQGQRERERERERCEKKKNMSVLFVCRVKKVLALNVCVVLHCQIKISVLFNLSYMF